MGQQVRLFQTWQRKEPGVSFSMLQHAADGAVEERNAKLWRMLRNVFDFD